MMNDQVEELYELVPIGASVSIIGQVFTGRVLIPGQASGTDVRALQEILRVLGYYNGEEDGVYGPATADAVRRFQAQHNLTPDAIVGPATYDALLRAFDEERGDVRP
jgi:peptidoglycan hydrolase-like protein with peptidoglycan-binding domain